ncbi:MAG: response regulator [Deltaproteobacteria bacterium]|nr:response regulator [Deltaproteobacteria bacterium]MBW2019333.1 response regulator [Deltaproteobacteria bacterium]
MKTNAFETILIIDDDENNLHAYTRILRRRGRKIITAKSGKEGLRQLLKHDICLIILDVKMPGMSGFETAELIKSQEKGANIPIIFVTAVYKSDHFIKLGFDIGAVDYVTKPVDSYILRSRVEVFLRLYHQQQELEKRNRSLRESEKALRKAYDELEVRVAERTADLAAANEKLRLEISEHKRAKVALRIQDKMAALGRVAAGIAHEIRNPLSGINMYLDTLEKIYDSQDSLDQVKEIIGELKSASNRIEAVIKRVMDFSRPTAPKLELKDINKAVEDAINLSSVTLRKSGIELEKALALDLPQCYADHHLIEQVILNLITNAAEALKNMNGPKKIEITTSKGDNCILITVSDSGPGVPLELRDKIFDPFFTTKNEGSGIGLSLSHRIITDHDGTMRVFTSQWGGAEFRIELPIEKTTNSR